MLHCRCRKWGVGGAGRREAENRHGGWCGGPPFGCTACGREGYARGLGRESMHHMAGLGGREWLERRRERGMQLLGVSREREVDFG